MMTSNNHEVFFSPLNNDDLPKNRIPFPQISFFNQRNCDNIKEIFPNSPIDTSEIKGEMTTSNTNDIESRNINILKTENIDENRENCILNETLTHMPKTINSLEQNKRNNKEMHIKKRRTRVPFTSEEDEKLKMLVKQLGRKNWSKISMLMNGRSPKQCRDRYSNYLIPGFFNGQWTNEEDQLLIRLYEQNGPKWSLIKQFFNGRTANSLKNRWNYFLSYKYEKSNSKNDSLEKENQKSDVDFDDERDNNDEFVEMVYHDNDLLNAINKSIIENDWFLID